MSPEELATGFVLEYLDRTPEYIDVVEWVDENDDEEPNDEILAKTYQEVMNILDTISQRYLDEVY